MCNDLFDSYLACFAKRCMRRVHDCSGESLSWPGMPFERMEWHWTISRRDC